MVFKRLLGSLGVGGPTVDTVLDPGAALPGGTPERAGPSQGRRRRLRRSSTSPWSWWPASRPSTRTGRARAPSSSTGSPSAAASASPRASCAACPFSVMLPWETPITELYGQGLGIVLGVRTELAVAGAKDKGDLDQLAVRPLPAQEAILEALGQLGFGFKSADLELGHIGGTGQQLPFYQEIELAPAPQYAHQVNEIEVTFLAGPGRDGGGPGGRQARRPLLRGPRRGHPLHRQPPRRRAASTGTPRSTAGSASWSSTAPPTARLRTRSRHGGTAPAATAVTPTRTTRSRRPPPRRQSRHRSGPGMGTVVAAGAAGLAVGVVGGMVAAEVVDEVGRLLRRRRRRRRGRRGLRSPQRHLPPLVASTSL